MTLIEIMRAPARRRAARLALRLLFSIDARWREFNNWRFLL